MRIRDINAYDTYDRLIVLTLSVLFVYLINKLIVNVH